MKLVGNVSYILPITYSHSREKEKVDIATNISSPHPTTGPHLLFPVQKEKNDSPNPSKLVGTRHRRKTSLFRDLNFMPQPRYMYPRELTSIWNL